MAFTLRRIHGRKRVSAAGRTIIAAAFFAVAACSSSTAPSVSGAILTDEPAYSARLVQGTGDYSFTVIATYFNHSRDTVFLETCGPDSPRPEFGVITAAAGSSADGYNPAWACVAHDKQIAVAGGTSRIDTLSIRGPVMRDGYTNEPVGALDGTFRVVYTVRSCRGPNGCAVPSSVARSNTFQVKRAG